MERISLFTSVVNAALVCGAMGVLLLILWRVIARQKALLYWGLAQISWALAMALMAARGSLSDALSILVANAAAVASMLFLWAGVAVFTGRRIPVLPMALVFGLYWITFPILTYAVPDIAARIVVVRLLMMVAVAGAIWCLWAPSLAQRQRLLSRCARATATLGLMPLSATFFASALVMLRDWDPGAAFFGHPVIIATVLGTTVAMQIWALVLLYLVIERRSIERETSAEMHSFLVEQTVSAMFVAEGNRLTYVNSAFAKMFGYSAEQIVENMTMEDLAVPEDRQRLKTALQAYSQGEVSETYPQYRALRADGSVIHVDGQARVLASEGREVLVGMLQDSTVEHQARKQAQQVQELLEETVCLRTTELQREVQTRAKAEAAAHIFRLAIEQVDAAVMLIDEQQRIIHANGACQSLVVSKDSKRYAQLDGTALDCTEPLQKAVARAISEKALPWTGEVSLSNSLTLAVTVSPLRSGVNPTRQYAVVATDISERVQVNQQMTQAKLAAEQNSRAKSEFLANMSHELRTPLNAILGFSEMISSEVWGAVGSHYYREYAKDIHGSAAHLLTVINDVLDIAAVEQGSLSLHQEWGSLRDVVDSSLRLVAPRARDMNLSWSVTMGCAQAPDVYADQRRLKQILLNLLSNAVKFTPQGGAIGVYMAATEDGGASLTVYDSGIGMDADGVLAALQRFGQVDSSLARRWEGTGLGLPLASDLAAMHGAQLSVDSSPGKGTRVSVSLAPDRCRWPQPAMVKGIA